MIIQNNWKIHLLCVSLVSIVSLCFSLEFKKGSDKQSGWYIKFTSNNDIADSSHQPFGTPVVMKQSEQQLDQMGKILYSIKFPEFQALKAVGAPPLAIRAGIDPYAQGGEFCQAYKLSDEPCAVVMQTIRDMEEISPSPDTTSAVPKNQRLKSILPSRPINNASAADTSSSRRLIASIRIFMYDADSVEGDGMREGYETDILIHEGEGNLYDAQDQIINFCAHREFHADSCVEIYERFCAYIGSRCPPIEIAPPADPDPHRTGELKHVLVTGGAGFLGRYFVSRLCKLGVHVTVVDSMTATHAVAPGQYPRHLQCPSKLVSFHRLDVKEFFKSRVSQRKWDLVIHLASCANDVLHTENIEIDIALFKWAVDVIDKTLPSKIIYMTSQRNSIRRDVAENWARIAREKYGLDVIVFRSVPIYGVEFDLSNVVNVLSKNFVEIFSSHDVMNDEIDVIYVEDATYFILDKVKSVLSTPFNVSESYESELSNYWVHAVESGDRHSLDHVASVAKQIPAGNPAHIDCNHVDDEKEAKGFRFRNILSGSKTIMELQALDSQCYSSSKSTEKEKRISDICDQHDSDMCKRDTKPDSRYPHLKPVEKPRYSSFSCSGGNQDFRNWKANSLGNNTFIKNRICLLKNVCWVNDAFHYFVHPEEVRSPSYIQFMDREFVKTSHSKMKAKPFFLTRVFDSIPPDNVFRDNKTWAFSYVSFSFNYAHLLVDDLMPLMLAMELFGENVDSARMVYSGCDYCKGLTNYYKPVKYMAQACRDNIDYYSRLVFGGEMAEDIRLWLNRTICLKKLIVGANHVLGLVPMEPDKYRAFALRKCRDAVMRNIPQDTREPPRLMRVLVIPKRSFGHTSVDMWTDFCDDINSIVEGIADVAIECLPEGLSPQDEIIAVRSATVIISEHGTVAYLALFAHDGAVLLDVSTKENLKDIHILPFTTHVRVFYTTLDVPSEFPGMVRYCLHVASENFNLQMTYIN